MKRFLAMYGMFDEDEYVLYTGRLATTSGLIGGLLGLLVAWLNHSGPILTAVIWLLFFYIFVSGFWGGYKVNMWVRKYRYRLPQPLWQVLRVLAVAGGAILGVCGWGGFEHFLLILLMDVPKLGAIGAQLILLPVVGRKIAGWLNYSPRSVDPIKRI